MRASSPLRFVVGERLPPHRADVRLRGHPRTVRAGDAAPTRQSPCPGPIPVPLVLARQRSTAFSTPQAAAGATS